MCRRSFLRRLNPVSAARWRSCLAQATRSGWSWAITRSNRSASSRSRNARFITSAAIESRLPLRDRLSRVTAITPLLRHVIIRATADGREASAMLVVRRNDKALRAPIKKFLASPEKPDGFFINIHDKPGPFMVGDETIKIEGRSHVKEVVGGISYLVSPTAFFQTNVGAAAVLVKLVLEEVGPAKTVLDLYCGSGLFSLQLAKAGARVTGVEENRQAIKDAEANLRLNRLPEGQVRFIAGRAEDSIRGTFDAVVLDPPRQGCPPRVLSAVFEQLRPARGGLRLLQPGCAREGVAGYPQDRLPRDARAAS